MDFRFIHTYSDDSTLNLDVKGIASEIAELFPSCTVDVRPQFFRYLDAWDKIELARISDIKQPFEKQPKHNIDNNNVGMISLYDGFVLQQLFADLISDIESDSSHIHLIFTSLMICTFSEDDWRYHGRTVICGMPSIISSTGIVEAPAKPREFYLAQYGGFTDINSLKKQLAAKFIDYDDDKKMKAAALGYALQSIFFFITDGMPFCENKNCRLFNAHWQEDLIHAQVKSGRLCRKHQSLMNKFNARQ